jgi:lipopolysaccharide biosynthesis glycosyltransferase
MARERLEVDLLVRADMLDNCSRPSIEEGDALAIAIDERYMSPACAMLNSLAQSLGTPDKVPVKALMPADTSQAAIEHLASHAKSRGLRLDVQLVPEDLSRLPIVEPYTSAVYLNLPVADLLPETRRIVYLDVDLVVLQDVTKLLRFDLAGAPLAAVQDGFIATPDHILVGDGQSGMSRCSSAYFNAGVMVIDADMWREERIAVRAMKLVIESTPPLRWLSQDALNILTDGRWAKLDPRWNVFTISDQLAGSQCGNLPEDALAKQGLLEQEAFILHFVGPCKPWHENYPQTSHWNTYRRFTAAG